MKNYFINLYENLIKFFNKEGELHREVKSAGEYPDGSKFYNIKGEKLTEKEFNQRMNPTIEMTMEEVCKELGKNIKIIKS